MSKSAKHRFCPAAGREISSAECGENRGSRYACPADCPHYPFASARYDSLLAIEDAVNEKSLAWLREHALHPALLESAVRRAIGDTPERAIHRTNALIAWAMFFERDAAGLTCAEHWERAGFAGLKNDERVMLRGRMQSQVGLIEVRRVLDRELTEVVELLAPGAGPFLIADRSLAAMATRFACLLTWLYPLPLFRRLSGTAITVEAMGPCEPAEVVREVARHLGGPVEERELRVWLAQNFMRFTDALDAARQARRQQMLAGIDAHFGKVVYELQAPPDECLARLDGVPEVEEDDLSDDEEKEGFREARVWFADAGESLLTLPRGGKSVLGRVLLGPAECRLEAMTAERTARLRQRFEARLGERVKFMHEAREDLRSRFPRKDAAFDPAQVPPRLLAEPERIVLTSSRVPPSAATGSSADYLSALRRAQDREFADMPLPALGGRTPRQAACDPAWRPTLARFLKARIRAHDEQNLRTGRTDDINWLPRELGMDELILDPPPRRPPLDLSAPARPPSLSEAGDPEADDGLTDQGIDRPPPPPLPAEPFTEEQAVERLRAAVAPFPSAKAAVEEIHASGSTLIQDVRELTADLINDEEFGALIVLLLQAWFALVPPGSRAPAVAFQALDEALHGLLQRLLHAGADRSGQVLKEVLDHCRQPALTGLLMAEATEALPRFHPHLREEAGLASALVLLVVVEELDRALRPAAGPRG